MELVVENLTKVYSGDRRALDGVNLEISTGLFGLLGPNGAGKTTLMRILAALLKPTSGSVLIDGRNLAESRDYVKRSLGYLPQDFRGFPTLTVKEFLDYSCTLRRMQGQQIRRGAVETVLESTGLTEVRNRLIKKLSGGMHRRVGIAQALLGPPDLLIVDEPTVGLDPEERIKLRGVLSQIGEGRTIILSTHIVGDISSSCERMAILDNGTIVFSGRPSSLISKAQGRTWEFAVDADAGLEEIKARDQIVRTLATRDGLRMRVVGDEPPCSNAEQVAPTLEDAYVLFMGDRLRESPGLVQAGAVA